MTPPAMTAAGRGASTGRKVRKPTAPRIPRRVSGPVQGRAGGATVARAPAPVRAPAAPKSTPAMPAMPATPATPSRTRRSKTAAPPRTRRSRTAAAPRTGAGVAARAGAFIRSLPDHSLLDRIVRGRAWIPLLGVLLAGIVAMQVEVLKLGASIGRSLERSTALEGRNEILRANVAALADDQRIERLAAKMGMIMPGPDQVAFLAGAPNGNLDRATASIHAPDPSNFASSAGVVTAASAMASTGTSPTNTTQTSSSSTVSSSTGSTGSSSQAQSGSGGG